MIKQQKLVLNHSHQIILFTSFISLHSNVFLLFLSQTQEFEGSQIICSFLLSLGSPLMLDWTGKSTADGKLQICSSDADHCDQMSSRITKAIWNTDTVKMVNISFQLEVLFKSSFIRSKA